MLKKRLFFILGGVLVIMLLSNSFYQKHIITAFQTYDHAETYRIYTLSVPDKFSFADEKVPLSSLDVKERFDRELLVNTYWQSNMLLLLKRAHRYFPVIGKILEEEGVPQDFKYLAVAESGLQNVISPKGAKGFWQIMKSTGKEYGLEVNENVDERFHLEHSTRAACQYLKDAKENFGSWTLAAASYNRGMNGINNLLKEQQVDNYYDLHLGAETSRYIFRILAFKEIMNNPSKYGFVYKNKDLYPTLATREIEVDTAIANLTSFSSSLGITYKELKQHNPWLIEGHLNNSSHKRYMLRIPVD